MLPSMTARVDVTNRSNRSDSTKHAFLAKISVVKSLCAAQSNHNQSTLTVKENLMSNKQKCEPIVIPKRNPIAKQITHLKVTVIPNKKKENKVKHKGTLLETY